MNDSPRLNFSIFVFIEWRFFNSLISIIFQVLALILSTSSQLGTFPFNESAHMPLYESAGIYFWSICSQIWTFRPIWGSQNVFEESFIKCHLLDHHFKGYFSFNFHLQFKNPKGFANPFHWTSHSNKIHLLKTCYYFLPRFNDIKLIQSKSNIKIMCAC